MSRFPSKSIVICATQRCGSTLFCNDLENNELGRPEEHFLPLVLHYEENRTKDIIPDLVGRGSSGNGLFAVKVMASYVPVIEKYIAARAKKQTDKNRLSNFAAAFKDALWVFIRRNDVTAQAVSQLMSRMTGINHAVIDKDQAFVPGKSMVGASESYNESVDIPDNRITESIEAITRQNRMWEDFFRQHGIEPVNVVYEDLLGSFDHVRAIRARFGLPDSPVVETRNLVKLSNKKSDSIIESYKSRHRETPMSAKAEDKGPVSLGIDVNWVQKVSTRWVKTPYYDAVEQHAMGQWVGLIAPFLSRFPDLERSHVLEIAVGHGRMTKILLEASDRVTGVDVLQENIDFCAERFKDNPKLALVKTDGATLKEIGDNEISFMFCFDSMVHFDSDVVRSYLREARRALKPGGYFFTHHSNFTRNPAGDFQRAPHARNFMSEPLMRHYAKKEGMDVAATRVIDWGAGDKHVKDLDCLTLLKKPA